MPGIKVLVGDSQRLVAHALGLALAQYPDLEVLDPLPVTGLEAAVMTARLKPDVAVLDYWMPVMDGPTSTTAILGWVPGAKVILLSWFHGVPQVQAALKAGAVGFLPKSVHVGAVAEAIRRAHAGENPVFGEQLAQFVGTIRGGVADWEQRWQRLMTLTPREVEVLQRLASGGSMQEIARSLSVTPGTLRIHVQNIMSKTKAKSKVEAIAMAREEGLLHK